MTSKERLLQFGLITTSILSIIYIAKNRTASERCRRSTYDLAKLRGKTDVDSLNEAYDYCGASGGVPMSAEGA